MKKKLTKTRMDGVYKVEDGRWLIKATVTEPLAGKRVVRERKLGAHLSLDEAVERRWRLRSELKVRVARSTEGRGALSPLNSARTTVASYALEWASNRAPDWKPSYREHVADVLSRRVMPVLGSLVAEELRREHLQGWVRHVEGLVSSREQAYALDTLRSWWRVLATMARDLGADFGIPDPTRRVRPPKSTVSGIREGRTLTLEQLTQLLETVREHYPQWFAEAYTAAWTGLRAGEIRALHWEDVRFDEGVIWVHRAVSGGELSTTKTGKGREATLTSPLREVLQSHRNQMVRQQHPGLTSGLVFPNQAGGVRGQNALAKVLRFSAKSAGIPVRVGPQVLRRTFNTLLCLQGVPREVVRAQMGHTSQAMTNRYFQSDSAAIASAVESLQIRSQAGGGKAR